MKNSSIPALHRTAIYLACLSWAAAPNLPLSRDSCSHLRQRPHGSHPGVPVELRHAREPGNVRQHHPARLHQHAGSDLDRHQRAQAQYQAVRRRPERQDHLRPGPEPAVLLILGVERTAGSSYAGLRHEQVGMALTDRAAEWLGHGEGARWDSEYPWRDITIEDLATHTSGVCDYGNTGTACSDQNPGWQSDFERTKQGGDEFVYPGDAFTIARALAEQNSEPALAPGSIYEYSNVGHALLNYAVQRACGQSLVDIFDSHIRQPGMGSAVRPALIHTDEGQQFIQATGIAQWNALDGAAVLRLAGRLGIWDNRNVEPVRYWREVTKIEGNIPAAESSNRGVIYEINSRDTWTQAPGFLRLSHETFGHGGNYSTVFMDDPLTSTIIVRQGENNADGASYLTLNGCAPGWTGTSPNCQPGTDWSNNWDAAAGELGSSREGPRKMIVEPLQQAFFFPPPFCRMIAAAGQPVDNLTDAYTGSPGAATVELTAEIQVDPREGQALRWWTGWSSIRKGTRPVRSTSETGPWLREPTRLSTSCPTVRRATVSRAKPRPISPTAWPAQYRIPPNRFPPILGRCGCDGSRSGGRAVGRVRHGVTLSAAKGPKLHNK